VRILDIEHSRHLRPVEYGWHVLARWWAVAFLALAALVARGSGFIPILWPLLAVTALMAGYNFLLQSTHWMRWQPDVVTRIVLFADVLALTAYLHFAGDIENPLALAYCLPVVAGALLLSKRSAFLLAGASIALFFALIALTAVDVLPVHLCHYHLDLLGNLTVEETVDPDSNPQGWNYIGAHMISLAAVLFGCAYGFGTLADRIHESNLALERENERIALLLNIIPDGVVLLDRSGAILHSNPAAAPLVRTEGKTKIGELDPRLELPRRIASFAGPIEEFETHFDGRVLEHTLASRAEGNRIAWVIQDLTEQRRLTAQVMHMSKMIDLGLLAAGIAHEIGNPLSSMSAIIDVMEMKQTAPGVSDKLKSLRSHVERIHRIVQDVTSFARPSAGRRTRIAAPQIVDKALQIFRLHERTRGIRLDVHASDPALVVDVVEDQLVQVLLNLLLNAVDASSREGTVGVRASAAGGRVLLAVSDSGIGMSEETKRRLFTPFFTTKDPGKGVGLGLFISESIVRGHGGTIEVQTAEGKGATFTVSLPAAPLPVS
jgi:signal transduction histidine kinase